MFNDKVLKSAFTVHCARLLFLTLTATLIFASFFAVDAGALALPGQRQKCLRSVMNATRN
jgi:hypothetical protein